MCPNPTVALPADPAVTPGGQRVGGCSSSAVRETRPPRLGLLKLVGCLHTGPPSGGLDTTREASWFCAPLAIREEGPGIPPCLPGSYPGDP